MKDKILTIYDKLWNIKAFIFSKQARIVHKWYKNNAENTLRYDYLLNDNSLVLDLGGYKGDFTKKIVDKFNCNVMVFEPVFEYSKSIKERFENNNKVKIFTFGLEDKDSTEKLYLSNDGSSVYRTNEDNSIDIVYKDVEVFFGENNIENVDLMKINIEGGEYALLEKMIQANLICRIDNIQVQFHNIKGLESEYRMKAIWKELEKTHYITWKYRPYVWENWKRK